MIGIMHGQPNAAIAVPGQDTAPGEVGRWVARELHDSVVQPLTALLVEMELLKLEQASGGISERLDHFQAATRGALGSLRQTVCELRGEPVRDEEFHRRLGRLVADLRRRGLAVSIRARHWPAELPAHASYNLSRIAEEAVCNVLRHSRARRVTISLAGLGTHLVLAIRDDGVGWSPLAGGPEPGQGIIGMAERALLLGGDLRVTAVTGRGTTVRLLVARERVT